MFDKIICEVMLKELSTGELELLDKEIALPNIPFPVCPEFFVWDTVCEINGWKLQQNMMTRHARIVDNKNIRKAWGTINGMIRAMDRMAESLQKSEHIAIEKLKKLKELWDCGIITQSEYETKKRNLLQKI
jgi:hypothetical protein